MVFIYCLFDTSISKPIYVGATINPAGRLCNHKNKTLAGYANKDSVTMEILEEVTDEQAGEKELFWFNKYKNSGFPLLRSECKKYPSREKPEVSLKEEILKTIDTPHNRVRIAAAMGVGEQAVYKYIKNNDTKLTQFAALQVIKMITGIKKESDLLEEIAIAKAV